MVVRIEVEANPVADQEIKRLFHEGAPDVIVDAPGDVKIEVRSVRITRGDLGQPNMTRFEALLGPHFVSGTFANWFCGIITSRAIALRIEEEAVEITETAIATAMERVAKKLT